MIELNMDGLVGPTHHYAGLSAGNLASMENALSEASPKAAALQGIAKMRLLHEMGIPQAFLPPHARPFLRLLKQLGFEGPTHSIIEKAYKFSPQLLSAAFSASNMWTANAATVSNCLDTKDKRTHFTAANLNANIHRHIETTFSEKLLRIAFSNPDYFVHHPALPKTSVMGDEGAANHTRLGLHHQSGINLFVYGQHNLYNNNYLLPRRYLARQTLDASKQIAFTHGLDDKLTLFACQNPEAIDQGVFHNDVISVGNETLLLIHEHAYVNQKKILSKLKEKADFDLKIYQIKNHELSISEAVSTYIFNSQIISIPNSGNMLLLSPSECEQSEHVRNLIQGWINDNDCPITEVIFLNLKQSMLNGGGPACLRLRVPIRKQAFKTIHPGFLIDDKKLNQLEKWVSKHYRDKLHLTDLCDPKLIDEVFVALDDLSIIMNVPNLYHFQ